VKALTPAETLLKELGVTEAQDIDLEAIAWCLGARVKYRPLDGCEARIAGSGDQAIITVSSRCSHRRRRFSLAHELGHWKYHRGRLLVCRADEIGRAGSNYPEAERVANNYAAQLLMPGYLLAPRLLAHPKLNFQTVRSIAEAFDTSRTATAIRLVEAGHAPSLLICHGMDGRKWFTRSPGVPERWFPQDTLDPESFAFQVLHGQAPEDAVPRLVGADAWFDRSEAGKYEVREQTIRIGPDRILTMVLIRDDEMLDEWNTSYQTRRR